MADTTCVVVGGGPAGMMLGLLLARAGIEVTVLEKHADFLRDFRGDTVHASTLTLLDELGLGREFAQLPHRLLDHVTVELDQDSVVLSLERLPGAHQHIAMVPQWDFLELLATAAAREPSFRLIRNAEATGLLWDEGRVVGVRYRDRTVGGDDRRVGDRAGDGDAGPAGVQAGNGDSDGYAGVDGEHEIRAVLTVGCDGRGSAIRAAAGLAAHGFGTPPMDVWWFRLPHIAGDPVGAVGRISAGHMAVMLDRGDYWQCAYLIPKGTDASHRTTGIEALRTEFARLVPWTGDRLGAVSGWDDVKLLDVKLDRVRPWSREGLLLIGDAAHAMSPVGGVGINLAVADAVAAARLLAAPLRAGQATPGQLRAVQRRRWWPTALIQGGQRLAHRFALAPAMSQRGPTRLPAAARLLLRSARLRSIPARMVAIGPLPEHAPDWARRPPAP